MEGCTAPDARGVGTRGMGYGGTGRSVVVPRGMGPGHQSITDFGPNKGKPLKSANFREILEKVLIYDFFDISDISTHF